MILISVRFNDNKKTYHPGVLHVDVLVCAVVVVVLVLVAVVVGSEPLLWMCFQLKQSMHSSSGTHSATAS